jgi:hypothetical protein
MLDMPAIVISLRDQKERQKNIATNIQPLWSNLKFLYVDRHINGGAYGCFESHIIALKTLSTESSEFVAVFEDDVIPTCFCDNYIQDVLCQFKNTNFDMCYLGCNDMMYDRYHTKIDANLVEMRFTAMHAIVYRKESIFKILRYLENCLRNWVHQEGVLKHIDHCLKENHDISMVGAVPILYDQNRTFESANEPWCNDLGDFCIKLINGEHIRQSVRVFASSTTKVERLVTIVIVVFLCFGIHDFCKFQSQSRLLTLK